MRYIHCQCAVYLTEFRDYLDLLQLFVDLHNVYISFFTL